MNKTRALRKMFMASFAVSMLYACVNPDSPEESFAATWALQFVGNWNSNVPGDPGMAYVIGRQFSGAIFYHTSYMKFDSKGVFHHWRNGSLYSNGKWVKDFESASVEGLFFVGTDSVARFEQQACHAYDEELDSVISVACESLSDCLGESRAARLVRGEQTDGSMVYHKLNLLTDSGSTVCSLYLDKP